MNSKLARIGATAVLVTAMAVSPTFPAPGATTDVHRPSRSAPAKFAPAAGFSRARSAASLYHLKTAPLRKLARASELTTHRKTRLGPAAPAARRPAGLLNMPFPDQSFQGMSSLGTGAPPDPSGEAGPNHYVQATNVGFQIFTKNGNTVMGPAKIDTLWAGVGDACENKGRGDPIVQYDQLAQRWVITQFAFDKVNNTPTAPFFECVAVSQTADPLRGYFLYSFPMGNLSFPDYPHFGVWPDAYYMTVHLFQTGEAGQFQRLGVFAFDREAMLRGAAATRQFVLSDPGTFYGMLPADADGSIPPPTGSSNFLVALNDSRDQILLYKYFIDWMDPSASGVQGPAVLQTGPWDGDMCGGSHSCIPQAQTPTLLDPAANQSVMYRAAYRNFGDHEALVVNHTVDATGTDKAGVRWYEIGDLQAAPFIAQGSTYSPPDDLHRWMGSIAMDRSGDIAVGFSGSSAQEFPSVRYAGRLVDDPPDTLAQGEVFLAGQGSQLGTNRWGDYTHLSVDPSDDCTFWYTGEYYPQSTQLGWSTAIVAFRFPSCDPRIPPPPDETAPRVTNVHDGPDPLVAGRKSSISFTLSEEANVDVGVFKGGNLVRMLVTHAVIGPGHHVARWRGSGRPGKYSYTIEARDAGGNVRRAGGKIKLLP